MPVSDLSQDFIINKGDRPDGMRGPSASDMWGDVDIEPSPVGFSRGYVERDLEAHPVGSLFGSTGVEEFNKIIPLIPWEEVEERIAEMNAKKTRLSDIRMIGDNGNPIVSLDQNGQGYCWAYSPAAAITLRRAQMGLPHIRLSAHSLACRIKNFRDEGGWCGLSTTDAIKVGYVPTKYWTEKSMSRSLNNQANWDIAQNFRVTEGFLDLQQPVHGKTLTFQQVVSCLLAGVPVPGDFNWWSHSICLMDVEIATLQYPMNDPRRYGIRIWNSWRDSWGRLGTGVIVGNKVVPDGAVAIRDVTYCEEV